MAQLLMPKATAIWLVENTALSFEQIAAFCGLHQLEIQAIADGDVAIGMQGLDPVAAGQLTQEEIDRCQNDPAARLQMAAPRVPESELRPKGARYTPVSKRQDRPDGIAWVIKNYPEMSDAQICRLLGTTKPTIASVRDKTHWNASGIRPRNPVHLGLCGIDELEKMIAVARARAGTAITSAANEEPADDHGDDEGEPIGYTRPQAEPTVESVFGPQTPRNRDED